MAQSRGPLDGVKVVACSTAQAGTVPYMLMADLGAEVIKIEVPNGGDRTRAGSVFPGLPSTIFETCNRGVKSVTLNLKSAEAREILHRLVARADIFGQNFRPGAAEKNGYGYEDLKKINPKLVYVSISGYGPKGPHANLPGTDSMAQALGGIAEAYSSPGQPLRTGVVSVADETCAILAFGGMLAALHCARTQGIGQKVECSLLGGQIRLMGWTLTTAMWRNRNPVTGQARITGTPERPGMSASFNDIDGKPLVFQLNGAPKWKAAMSALGFYDTLVEAGFGDLGVVTTSDEQARDAAQEARRALRDRPARQMGRAAARRGYRFGADQHAARSIERSRCPRQWLRDRGRVSQARQEAESARLAVEFLRNAGARRHRAGAGRAQRRGSEGDRLQRGGDPGVPRSQGDLISFARRRWPGVDLNTSLRGRST